MTDKPPVSSTTLPSPVPPASEPSPLPSAPSPASDGRGTVTVPSKRAGDAQPTAGPQVKKVKKAKKVKQSKRWKPREPPLDLIIDE